MFWGRFTASNDLLGISAARRAEVIVLGTGISTYLYIYIYLSLSLYIYIYVYIYIYCVGRGIISGDVFF